MVIELRVSELTYASSRKAVLGSMFASLALLLFLVPAMVPDVSAAAVTTLCSSLPNSDGAGGASFGMGGIKTKAQGLVLALTSFSFPGLWLCYNATTSGCGSKSAFISLPSSFCSSQPTHGCSASGTALDKSLNLFYVDAINADLVECTASSGYQSCKVLPASSAFSGFEPSGLFLRGSTFFVSDRSCSGKVWNGTSSSLSVIATVGDQLISIAVSSKNPSKALHVYVGDAGACKGVAAHVVDATDGKPLPTPFTSSMAIEGLDSSLQFTAYTGAAYKTPDTG